MRAAVPLVAALLGCVPAQAQQLDLSHGGPIDITARDGMEWRQEEKEVIARGDAQAVRDNTTVTGDRLTAWYRKKDGAAPVAPTPAGGIAGDPSTEGNEIYRMQSDGHVTIFTATDRAQGDKAVYDLDQSVLVLTGKNLKLTTPNEIITARDDLEYWPDRHMAVARGNAVVVTSDARRIAADTLVAYTVDNPPPDAKPGTPQGATPAAAKPGTTPAAAKPGTPPANPKPGDDPLMSSGRLQRVEAFGHVSVRTPTDTVTGERGVYVADTDMARIAGNVRITRGQNQLNGAEALVNMKTGVANLVSRKAGRVHGLVVPNDPSNKGLDKDPVPGKPKP